MPNTVPGAGRALTRKGPTRARPLSWLACEAEAWGRKDRLQETEPTPRHMPTPSPPSDLSGNGWANGWRCGTLHWIKMDEKADGNQARPIRGSPQHGALVRAGH